MTDMIGVSEVYFFFGKKKGFSSFPPAKSLSNLIINFERVKSVKKASLNKTKTGSIIC